ncbi:zinc-dependent alcohol dehydrogenase [Paenibacillus qinlingensis]|uniref:zinc-dependent alcohol dehydrogenase n=1 Tax=Paenibacillus qinlingensis TaxID=1837343 RepID=UPI00156468C6|nr:zinc-binding alcohol dehydrogenase [Paenibacillus qinlingensis]NQX60745.1 zinc-binding alcohol dehydrogenase [Paenibacillus qinlingensis]
MNQSRKIVFPGPYEVSLSQALIPDLAPNQIRVKSTFSLISPGTELALFTGTHTGIANPDNNWAKYPFEPGYATVGIVEAIGANVAEFDVGQHVFAIAPHASHNVMTIDEDQLTTVFALPAGSKTEHAAFARLAAISATSILQANVEYGDVVAILGMGLIGQFAAQLYALHGAQVIAVDPVQQRLQIAQQVGIPSAVESIQAWSASDTKLSSGKVVDLVVEATGIPDMVNSALELVKPLGKVVLLGSPRGTATIKTYEHIHCKGIQLTGAHENLQNVTGTHIRSRYIRHMLELIAKGKLQVEPLLTHTLPAGEAQAAYELLLNAKESTLGVLLDWGQS